MIRVSLLALILLTFATFAEAQNQYTPNRSLALPPAAPGTWGEDINNNFRTLDKASIPRYTVASKPTTNTLGDVIVVTDAATASTCTTAGGTSQNTCQWNGTTWIVIGGAAGGGGSAHIIEDEGTPVTQRSNMNFVGAGVTVTDSGGKTTVTIPSVSTDPTIVKNNQSNTYTGGDQDFGAATSLGLPRATGAAPTQPGRCAFDLTSQNYKCGLTSGGTITLASTAFAQPLNNNLTQISALTPSVNQAMIFRGTAWTLYTRPNCNAANQAVSYDNTTGIEGCTTFTGGLTGATSGKYLIATGPTSFETASSILSNAAGNLHVAGGMEVNCTTGTDCVTLDTSGYTGHVPYTITVPYVGASASVGMTVGAKTSGNVVKFDAAGAMIAGGLAGTGDVTLAGPNILTNTTMDEASGNVFKVTKSIQPELYGPTTDNATCTGCYIFRVPSSLNGTKLTAISGNVYTAGTTGVVTVQVVKCAATASGNVCSGTTVNMLSTAMTIDSGENSTTTAATPAVPSVTAGVTTVATGDVLRIDVTTVHTTPAKGLIVNLDFKLP